MLYLHFHGHPVHRIPSGPRTDAACYVLERKATSACGCDHCRLSVWMMDVLFWRRMRHSLRTDRQRAAYSLRAVRLLDRAEAFIRTGKLLRLEELTIDRGVAMVATTVEQLRTFALPGVKAVN